MLVGYEVRETYADEGKPSISPARELAMWTPALTTLKRTVHTLRSQAVGFRARSWCSETNNGRTARVTFGVIRPDWSGKTPDRSEASEGTPRSSKSI